MQQASFSPAGSGGHAAGSQSGVGLHRDQLLREHEAIARHAAAALGARRGHAHRERLLLSCRRGPSVLSSITELTRASRQKLPSSSLIACELPR